VLRRRWPIDGKVLAIMERKVDSGGLSVRGFDRSMRVAWTVADLAGHDKPNTDDVAAASYLRTGS
jgi:magnesium chelatase family protein